MAYEINSMHRDLIDTTLERLAAQIGVATRHAQRDCRKVLLSENVPGVRQVFALCDHISSQIGKCMMADMDSVEPRDLRVPLLVKAELFDRVACQSRWMELHAKNVVDSGIPFQFPAMATERTRSCKSPCEYNEEKHVNRMAANARHVWKGDWTQPKRGPKLALEKLIPPAHACSVQQEWFILTPWEPVPDHSRHVGVSSGDGGVCMEEASRAIHAGAVQRAGLFIRDFWKFKHCMWHQRNQQSMVLADAECSETNFVWRLRHRLEEVLSKRLVTDSVFHSMDDDEIQARSDIDDFILKKFRPQLTALSAQNALYGNLSWSELHAYDHTNDGLYYKCCEAYYFGSKDPRHKSPSFHILLREMRRCRRQVCG